MQVGEDAFQRASEERAWRRQKLTMGASCKPEKKQMMQMQLADSECPPLRSGQLDDCHLWVKVLVAQLGLSCSTPPAYTCPCAVII